MMVTFRKKQPGLVKNWADIYGQPKPRICALLTRGRSGSHFILHKLQGHPGIIALEERVLNGQLKDYFNSGLYELSTVEQKQLLPRKADLAKVSWIVLNKPKISDVTYHFPFHRENMRLFQLMRNPVTLFLSWQKGWDDMARRDYGLQAAPRQRILEWIETLIRTEVAEFSLWASPNLDRAFALESIISNPDSNLSTFFDALEVEQLKDAQLQRLTHCVDCNVELKSELVDGQSVLVCPKCKRSYRASGGYNYIRQEQPERLASWKKTTEGNELFDYFAKRLGDYMSYYRDELYLREDGHKEFEDAFARLQRHVLNVS